MPPGQMAKVLSPVAEKLGMSGDELKTAMRSGKTLDEIATSKGVSHEDLVASIKKGLDENKPAGSNQDTTKLAESIAAGKGPGRTHGARPPKGGGDDPDGDGDHHGGPPPGGATGGATAAQSATLDALASLLKLSKADLTTRLSSGQAVSQMAKDQGVSTDKVADLLVKGLNVDAYA